MYSGVFVLLVSLAVASDARPVSIFKSGSKDWDHYIFVQQYPAGICAYEGRPCGYPTNTSAWTIHGLWPTLGDTKNPNYCNNSVIFNVNEVKDLLPRLKVDWTDLMNATPYFSFWKHEYEKHGSCSDFTDEHTFFKTILDYYENGKQFGDILANGNVRPSKKPYDRKDILNALNDELGAYPYSVDCGHSANSGQYLKQIGICLDKQMNVMDCPSKPSGTCRMDHPILYSPSIYNN